MQRNIISYLMKYYPEKLNWYDLSKNSNIVPRLFWMKNNTFPIIDKYKAELDWYYISLFFPEKSPEEHNLLLTKYFEYWDFIVLSMNPNFLIGSPEYKLETLKKYKNKISFQLISDNPNLTLDLVEKYIKKLDKDFLQRNPNIIPVLDKYWPVGPFSSCLSSNPNLTWNIIEKNLNRIDLKTLNKSGYLEKIFPDLETFKKFLPYIDFDFLSRNPSVNHILTYPENIFDQYKIEWNWKFISQNIDLTKIQLDPEDIDPVDKYYDFWVWSRLSKNKFLTPELINRYFYSLDIRILGLNLNLTPEIILKYFFPLNLLLGNPVLSTECLEYLYEMAMDIDPKIISLNLSLDLNFVLKHLDDLELELIQLNLEFKPEYNKKILKELHNDLKEDLENYMDLIQTRKWKKIYSMDVIHLLNLRFRDWENGFRDHLFNL